MALSTVQQAETITGEVVSSDYFSLLGVKPGVGRGFLPEEDRAAQTHAVTVLSYDLWQTHFGGATGIVGRSVHINGYPFIVVGVAPRGFRGTFAGIKSELWVPLAMSQQVFTSLSDIRNRDTRLLMGIGRLRPGISIQKARANLNGLAGQLAREFPNTNRDRGVSIVRFSALHPALTPTVSRFFGALMGVTAMTLLIACTNLANLLLARGSARSQEIGIRLALGASRSQIVKQLLTESLMLAIAGCAVGLVLSAWTSRLLALSAPVLPFAVQFDLHPDARVLAFSFIACLFATVAFGLIPSVAASRQKPDLAFKDYAAKVFNQHFGKRDILLAAQLSVSVVLLFGAALLLRSLGNARSLNPGFDAQGVAVASIDVNLLHYDQARGRSFYRRLLERVQSIPAVESASLACFVPLSGQGDSVDVVTEDDARSGRKPVTVGYNIVTAQYFQTLRIPVLQGRGFRDNGPDSSADVLIDEAMVRRFWPGEIVSQVLGRRMSIRAAGAPFSKSSGLCLQPSIPF